MDEINGGCLPIITNPDKMNVMRKKPPAPIEGICKLTGLHGKYIASHILPKALTRAEGLGPGLLQSGKGQLERRASSWYDRALVVSEGEEILAEYDNWAIAFLRKNALIWSGWGPRNALSNVYKFPKTQWGIRQIDIDGTEQWLKLRLFFISILWRAAATSLVEFDEIKLSNDDLEKIRKMVLEKNPEPLRLFPISLTQIATLGLRHNHTPIAQTKRIPSTDGKSERLEPIFRFYIDGLIIHFSRNSQEENEKLDLKKIWVGEEKSLIITTVDWDESFQAKNLEQIILESEQNISPLTS